MVACSALFASVEASALQPSLPLICLDPGHPSYEGDKLYEAIVNRKVVAVLERKLLDQGYNVVVTTRDIPQNELLWGGLDNESPEQQARLEVVPLEDRRDICMAAGAEIVLSVHHNYSFSSPKMNHTAVFYGSNDPWGKALAERVAKGLRRTMWVSGIRVGRDIDILGLSLTMLEPEVYTAILTEASFYSHPRERKRLNDDAYLKREARAIFRALHGFVISSLESANP